MRLLLSIVIICVSSSCVNHNLCSDDESNFKESWDETILELHKNPNLKVGYDVVTTKRTITLGSVNLYMSGQPGDSISKKAYSVFVNVYRDGEYAFTSRCCSEKCDTILERRFGIKEQ
jgi:hypothetical protein